MVVVSTWGVAICTVSTTTGSETVGRDADVADEEEGFEDEEVSGAKGFDVQLKVLPDGNLHIGYKYEQMDE